MTREKALEWWETKISKTEQLFVVLQALNFIHPRKPTQLPIVWKFNSHHMICVTKTVNGGCRLEFKHCSTP
jgi:hypothetical protein